MKKNILVVDDSALMRRVICDIINSDSGFQATDTCRDGLEAYEKLCQKAYDAVVLDVNMPRMNGLELLERLQKENIKATVVMVSTLTTKGQRFREKLIKVLATITAAGSTQTYQKKVITNVVKPAAVRKIRTKDAARSKIVAIACSTGGPKSLQSVIPLLKSNMDAPVLVVQHMPAGFTKSMAARLNELSPLDVKEANEGDVLEKGHVYVAPGGKHLLVQRLADGTHCIVLSDAPAIGGLRPCANLMYESLMDSGYDEITCVVLTGMGADGTKGISELQKEKNVYVIAQDEETSVVYGMPKAIAETGLVDEIVPLESVADTILKNVGVN